MKRLILSVLVVLAIAAVVAGCGSSNTSSSGNTELEGTWTETVPGTDIMPDMTVTFTFSGNNWDMIEKETATSTIWIQMSRTFILDPTANPKTLDLYITDFPEWSENVGTTLHSIYQLNGTNLAIANGQGGTRPTSFTADNTANLVKQ
jgi:uncharacterized protein (TIGR03067 family)